MRKSVQLKCSPDRSLLLLLTLFVMICGIVSQDNPREIIQTSPIERELQLYSRASGHLMQIKIRKKKGIIANVNTSSEYTWIVFESVGHDSLIRIKAKFSGRYLCFKSKGQLVSRLYARGSLCEFTEEIDLESWTNLRSHKMRNWYVGFKKNGKPEKGYKCKKKKCQFLKLYSRNRVDKKTFGPGLGNYPSFLSRASQQTQRHSVRHAKSKKERYEPHWLRNMR